MAGLQLGCKAVSARLQLQMLKNCGKSPRQRDAFGSAGGQLRWHRSHWPGWSPGCAAAAGDAKTLGITHRARDRGRLIQAGAGQCPEHPQHSPGAAAARPLCIPRPALPGHGEAAALSQGTPGGFDAPAPPVVPVAAPARPQQPQRAPTAPAVSRVALGDPHHLPETLLHPPLFIGTRVSQMWA